MAKAEPLEYDTRHVDVALLPVNRNWSTGTFACHLQPASCLLATVCPCVQFGINQRRAFQTSCFKWALIWLLPALALCLIIYLAVPASPQVELSHASAQAEALLQELDTTIKKHVSKHAHAHAAGHGHAASPPSVFPPPPLPPVKPPLDRSTAALYTLPLLMVAFGLVGCYRRTKLRSKYSIGGSAISDFLCHCCCTWCSIAREAREIRTQVVHETISIDADADDEYE
mmetsp:Transcript_62008/g.184548  ORF Transcript_62008/g.184548 Transcript_62008/m.184548 type:complete len:228 (+) Transcript_62008:2-685(+)